MVACALASGVGLIAFSLLNSGLIMFAQSTAANLSGLRGRQTLDKLNEIVRYAETSPQLITSTGVAATGNSAAGMLSKVYRGGPFLVKNSDGSTGDIPATANTFRLEYSAALAPPAPEVGDYLLIDSVSRPELEISQVQTLPNKTVNGQTIKCLTVTTQQPLGALVKPSTNRVAGYLHRRQALVFASVSGGNQLRYYPLVKSGTNFLSASNYRVLQGGYETLATKPFFQLGAANELAVNVQVHASGKTEYVELLNNSRSLTTLPVRATIRNITSK